MVVDIDMTLNELINKIDDGKKYFYRIDFGEGVIENKNFDNLIFTECMMPIKFTNSTLKNKKFISSNLKASIFQQSDLTNMVIEDYSVESIDFKNSTLGYSHRIRKSLMGYPFDFVNNCI